MKKPFKMPPKKYQPKGLSILYEDRDILVVDKRSGLLTMSTARVIEKTAYYRLTEYVRKGNSKSYNRVFIVHRLDRDTSGVIIFAKNEKAKHYLQDQWQEFTKTYDAIVHGTLQEKKGVITSYLAENSVHKMYSVTDPKRGKYAETRYTVVKETPRYSLLEISLETGKKNQIRVHLADTGCPVVGDGKYGKAEKGSKRLFLHSRALTITHPHTRETMRFKAKVPHYFSVRMNTVKPQGPQYTNRSKK